MKVVAVDPDPAELLQLTDSIRKVYSDVSVESFKDPLLAVKYVFGNPVDAVYTVTGMKRMSGFELAKLMRGIRPDLRLHFIAGSETERIDAMRMMAESCILRPVSAEALRSAAAEDW